MTLNPPAKEGNSKLMQPPLAAVDNSTAIDAALRHIISKQVAASRQDKVLAVARAHQEEVLAAAHPTLSHINLLNYLGRTPSQVPLRGLADYLPTAACSVTGVLPPYLLTGLTALPGVPTSSASFSPEVSSVQQQHSLVQSAQLLAHVNPGLAAATIAQALAMNGTPASAASSVHSFPSVVPRALGLTHAPAPRQELTTRLQHHMNVSLGGSVGLTREVFLYKLILVTCLCWSFRMHNLQQQILVHRVQVNTQLRKK